MYGDNTDLQVYTFRGNDNESVPRGVVKLIVDTGVEVLPHSLCYNHVSLQEVSLPCGLKIIKPRAFHRCKQLLKIKIRSTVKHIGEAAFSQCVGLATVEFEFSASSSSHQLETIRSHAFTQCQSLQRIKLPSSITSIGFAVFFNCNALIEANLSRTCLKEIPGHAFNGCIWLQTVCLPKSLNQICNSAFIRCFNLVTVIAPHDSHSIEIDHLSFTSCGKLANLGLPKYSTAKEDSFDHCTLLYQRYGDDSHLIVEGLMRRFQNFEIHRVCYENQLYGTTTGQQILQCIEEQGEDVSLVDQFGMTPFHILFSTLAPNAELLQVLFNHLEHPYRIVNWKDVNDKRPLDYLMNNWNEDSSGILFEMSLQKWMVEPLVNWGGMLWAEAMKLKLQTVLVEQDKQQRRALFDEMYSDFEQYERKEATSILELVLWKNRLRCGWTNDNGSNKRRAFDRVECRCVCGAGVVVPNVSAFLFT